MYGVDGQRPIDFDRTSRFDLESGCHGGGNKIDIGSNRTHTTDFTTSQTRKTSPFDDFSGNPSMLTSYVPKSRETPESGTDSDLKDVLRKLINWLSDSKKSDNTDGTSSPDEISGHKTENNAEKQTKSSETTTEKSDLSGEGDVIVVNEPIIVDGGVFDGKGATYTASSKLGDGGQSETQSPIFILRNGATLKNVNLGENGADGIHVYGGATLENVNWQNVGEDALTVKSAGDVTVIGGSAKGATDKIFQINADTTFYLKDFVADGFTTLVRTNGGKQIDADVTIDGGAFSNGSNVFRTDSSLASVRFLSDITLDNVKNWTRVGDKQSGV
ncbi:hypothetical protein GGE16_005206 [Rhizobium leguminosarum]|uniref:Pectate lyase n=1 Tax=Rhizobium leguminosarum TaxID=384 RepID=A0AAE2MPI3_RHILE|nr:MULTISPECIES: pectate lyase [Rhizobium]MBB4293121.1 hypothetical protein [Rhizobium leguminosarum]MBB4300056.1 hypothetical protein [Rhizobium leguminosarum]MBB4311182.1 hypothetical protein [Rhizobium leguminosarum]MBB4435409.1 hypothetical protein [Rhizobium esperanzae]MBB4532341.1 hypothetical protein [Rhizobium leguminosarum]